jgi:hypothetical protein
LESRVGASQIADFEPLSEGLFSSASRRSLDPLAQRS